MKKILLFLILSFSAIISIAQFNPTYDTIRFKGRTGKLWQIVTYGTADRLMVNGIMFYTGGAAETDPVWLAQKSDYYTKTLGDARYEYKITPGTYLTPGGTENVTGMKLFYHGMFVLNNAYGDGQTTITTTAGHSAFRTITFPDANGTVALTTSITNVTRYSAYSSGGINVEVLAAGTGITAAIANTNELTFTIPSGVKIISAKIRLTTGFSTLKIFMGTTDMGNTSVTNRWMPITQAWREDTGQQLTGMTTTMDMATFTKLTVNGLIYSTNNQIRISF